MRCLCSLNKTFKNPVFTFSDFNLPSYSSRQQLYPFWKKCYKYIISTKITSTNFNNCILSEKSMIRISYRRTYFKKTIIRKFRTICCRKKVYSKKRIINCYKKYSRNSMYFTDKYKIVIFRHIPPGMIIVVTYYYHIFSCIVFRLPLCPMKVFNLIAIVVIPR